MMQSFRVIGFFLFQIRVCVFDTRRLKNFLFGCTCDLLSLGILKRTKILKSASMITMLIKSTQTTALVLC